MKKVTKQDQRVRLKRKAIHRGKGRKRPITDGGAVTKFVSPLIEGLLSVIGP